MLAFIELVACTGGCLFFKCKYVEGLKTDFFLSIKLGFCVYFYKLMEMFDKTVTDLT